MDKTLVPVTVQIPRSLRNDVRKEAKRQDTKIQAIFRLALADWLKKVRDGNGR